MQTDVNSFFMPNFQSDDANGSANAVEGRVLQWKYASCRYNIEGASGFYTFSKSEALSKSEKEELVEKVAHYEAPDTFPKRPDAEELKSFPVAFSSFRLSNGKSVVCRTQYVGRDYGGTRFGNFFAHALVLDKGTWQDSIRYYCSGAFARGLTDEEIHLGRKPDALPEREAKSIKGDDALLVGAREKLDLLQGRMLLAVQKILDAFISALSKNANLVVYLDDKTLKSSAPAFLAFFFAATPVDIMRKISFSTYVYDPTTERLVNDNRNCYFFIAFVPSSSRERRVKPGVVSVDLSDLDEEYAPKYAYSKRLSRDFNAFMRRFSCPFFATTRPEDAIAGFQRERKEDARFLHDLARLYETLVEEDAFPTGERLTQTWRFLNEQPSDVADEILTTLLEKDYRKSENARETIREILAYCVRFNARLQDDGEEAEETLRRVDRVVAFWRRNIPKDASELKKWRIGLPEEIETIFGTNNAASRAAGTLEFKKTFSASAYFRQFVKRRTGELTEDWLILALGMFAAINEPNEIEIHDVKTVRATFERLRARLGDAWLNEFWSIYFKVWRAKITSSSSYDVLFRILGVREDEELFTFFVESLISDEIRDCWRGGVGWEEPSSAEATETTRKNRFLDQLVEQGEDDDESYAASSSGANLVLVTASSVEAARKMQRRRGTRGARTVATSTRKTDAPGADALACFFLESREFDALRREEFFGTFSKGEFKRALGYFLQFSRSANWREFRESTYGKDIVVPWSKIVSGVLLVLLFCGLGAGVWHAFYRQGVLKLNERPQRVESAQTSDGKNEVDQ